jgi:hypothetical protein
MRQQATVVRFLRRHGRGLRLRGRKIRLFEVSSYCQAFHNLLDSADSASYDAASLCIIDRLDRMGSQLNERLDALSHLNTGASYSGTQNEGLARLSFPTLETVLLWPIFEDCNFGLHSRQSLALRHNDEAQQHDINTEMARVEPGMIEPTLDGNLIHAAMESFLDNVHVKNPILDVQSFKRSIDMCLSLETQCNEQWALLVGNYRTN